MDPNSQHQVWSKWEYLVTPAPGRPRPSWDLVRANAARFARKAFGSAAQMNIIERTQDWEFQILVEGPPVHDPAYVEHIHAAWRKFLRNGFGEMCKVQSSAKLMAGDAENGKPRDQMIILPALEIDFTALLPDAAQET